MNKAPFFQVVLVKHKDVLVAVYVNVASNGNVAITEIHYKPNGELHSTYEFLRTPDGKVTQL